MAVQDGVKDAVLQRPTHDMRKRKLKNGGGNSGLSLALPPAQRQEHQDAAAEQAAQQVPAARQDNQDAPLQPKDTTTESATHTHTMTQAVGMADEEADQKGENAKEAAQSEEPATDKELAEAAEPEAVIEEVKQSEPEERETGSTTKPAEKKAPMAPAAKAKRKAKRHMSCACIFCIGAMHNLVRLVRPWQCCLHFACCQQVAGHGPPSCGTAPAHGLAAQHCRHCS